MLSPVRHIGLESIPLPDRNTDARRRGDI
jgi:hypothetical protein